MQCARGAETQSRSYPILSAIQNLVTATTGVNSRMAEEKWQRSTQRKRMHPVSAAPAINLRPTASGVEVHLRYITRAHAMPRVPGCITRSRLYSIKGNRTWYPRPGRQDLAFEDAKLIRPPLVGA